VTFRRRLTAAAAVAVAVSIALASAVVFVAVRSELRRQIDRSLQDRAATAGRLGPFADDFQGGFRGPPSGPEIVVQVRRGDEVLASRDVVLPAPSDELAVGTTAFEDVRVDGTPMRMLSVRLGDDLIAQFARSLDETRDVLRRLGAALLLLTAAGVGFAVVLGLAVTRTALAPLTALTGAVERVRATCDLTVRVAAGDGDRDEIARLAAGFDALLAELEGSVTAQRQLVADASHELRTPITVARANLDLLASGAALPADERTRLLADVRHQLEELTALVADVVDLARGADQPLELQELRLRDVVDQAVARARRHAPGATIEVEGDDALVSADEARVFRAVGNLLDNALKFGGLDGRIEVAVRGGTVSVRDHGPGIDPEDLPRLFDRFYRASAARSMPGSGLGLAIVRQVAEAHGGSVHAENATGGGAVLTLTLPPV
jgi:two-component system sensor histidine kinase MprB